MDPDRNSEEILRLRDRVHKLSNRLQEIFYWKHTVDRQLEKYIPMIEALEEARTLAEKIQANTEAQLAAARSAAGFRLTKWQTIAAVVVMVCTVGAFLVPLVLALTK